MKTKRILATAAGLAAVAVAVALLVAGRESRPSILLVTLDTTRADHLSCYGSEQAHTPRIDALAARGVRFENAETVAGLTLPSHASILTGIFPFDHGVRENGLYYLRPEAETLTERLAAAGYRTGAFVSSLILDSKYGLAQGFDVYDDDFETPLDVGTQFPVSRRGGETVDHAIRWLRSGGNEPAFVWVHLYDAHAPYEPPPPYDRAYRGIPYDGEIAYADLCLGSLFEEFESRYGENGVIVVTGDHGESLGDHGELTHGFFVYESTNHVPLVVHGGPFRGGREIEEPVRTVDLAPTFLELAGLEAPRGLRGRSLTGVLTGETRDLPCYAEAWTPRGLGWSGLRGLRVGNLKLVQGSRTELYDLASEGGESRDVAVERPADLARLRRILEETVSAPAPGRGGRRNLDESDIDALMALGYVSAAGGAPGGDDRLVFPDRADARDRIEVFNQVMLARSSVASGEWEDALERISKVVASDPANPDLRFERAQIMSRAGRGAEMMDDLRYAADHRPDDPRPLNLLGDIELAAGNPKEAERHFREALERSPNQFLALFKVGLIELAGERYEEAEKTFRHTLRLDEENVAAMNNLACALIKGKRDPDEGFRLIRRAVELAPDNGELRLSLGDALLNAGRKSEAIPELEKAREILGDRADVMKRLERLR